MNKIDKSGTFNKSKPKKPVKTGNFSKAGEKSPYKHATHGAGSKRHA